MCLKELLDALRLRNVNATEPRIRRAIDSGRVSRPRLDGSLRFDFTNENLEEIAAHFGVREAANA